MICQRDPEIPNWCQAHDLPLALPLDHCPLGTSPSEPELGEDVRADDGDRGPVDVPEPEPVVEPLMLPRMAQMLTVSCKTCQEELRATTVKELRDLQVLHLKTHAACRNWTRGKTTRLCWVQTATTTRWQETYRRTPAP